MNDFTKSVSASLLLSFFQGLVSFDLQPQIKVPEESECQTEIEEAFRQVNDLLERTEKIYDGKRK